MDDVQKSIVFDPQEHPHRPSKTDLDTYIRKVYTMNPLKEGVLHDMSWFYFFKFADVPSCITPPNFPNRPLNLYKDGAMKERLIYPMQVAAKPLNCHLVLREKPENIHKTYI